jgi:hypothetical protein
MAYVDLNPIRAGLAEGLESSAHTGASERIARARSTPTLLQESLQPIAGASPNVLSINSADYLQLLDWTGRRLVAGKRGKIDADAPAILSMIDRPDRWVLRVAGYGSEWARVVGTMHDLVDKADQIGQRWLKGLRLARQLG